MLIADGALDEIPEPIVDFLRLLEKTNRLSEVGFRRRNLPSLLLRFFRDLRDVFLTCMRCLKTNGEMMLVIGDSYTTTNGKRRLIPTTHFTRLIGEHVGLQPVEEIEISVTTDNHKHVRHAITKNVVIRMRKPA